ncbi:MAG: acetate--CoA ligase family protein [Pseudomonadota bacterium]
MNPKITRLLNPKSLAIIGGDWAGNVVEQCLKMGFKGDIWPVNPKRRDIKNIPCFKQIEDLPGAPDACFIGINRHQTIETVKKLASIKTGGAVCFASGFSETGDVDFQNALLKAKGDMIILGPNCYGFINYLDQSIIWPDQYGATPQTKPVKSGVAIISQSSNIAINLTMQQRGLPIAYVICTGNQAHLSAGELALQIIEDHRVTAVGFYLESMSAEAFATLANRARQLNKGLCVIKAGKSEHAQAACLSHSASMVGESTTASAFFSQCHMVEVNSLETLLETLKIMHCGGILKSPHLKFLCCSGGEASMIADKISMLPPLDLPPLSATSAEALRKELGDLVHIANPLDYHTFIWGHYQHLKNTYQLMIESNLDDLTILVMDLPRKDFCDTTSWQPTINAIIDAVKAVKSKHHNIRVAVLACLQESMPEELAILFFKHGIIPLAGLNNALKAIQRQAILAQYHQQNINWQPILPLLSNHDPSPCLLDEYQSKQWLLKKGFNVPQGYLLDLFKQPEQMIKNLGQGRFALKALGFIHKSEKHALKLNLTKENLVAEAHKMMRHMPQVKTFLIEEMISGAVCEILIAFKRDPIYGIRLTMGMGGVESELKNDIQTFILPVTPAQIIAGFKNLKYQALLFGYRNRPHCDIDTMVDVIVKLADMITHNHHMIEIEINPLIVGTNKQTTQIADALIWVDHQQYKSLTRQTN